MAEQETKQEVKEAPQSKAEPTPKTAVEHLQAAAVTLEAKDARSKAVKTFHSVAADVRDLIKRLESRGGA